MENKQVLSHEELNQIKEIKDLYSEIIIKLGEIDIQINEFEKSIDNLNLYKEKTLEEYQNLKIKEENIGKDLSSKYGDGTVDMNTGEFIPKN